MLPVELQQLHHVLNVSMCTVWFAGLAQYVCSFVKLLLVVLGVTCLLSIEAHIVTFQMLHHMLSYSQRLRLADPVPH